MDFNIGITEEGFGKESYSYMGSVAKPTVISILKNVDSGIGIDISKNHTGIVVWDGISITTHGFKLNKINKEDPHSEYRMRMDFRSRLSSVVTGKKFENCVVENAYGGSNFDTVRKLLALNTVVDELLFDGVFEVDNFYRWLQSEWSSRLRKVYKPAFKMLSKVETQNILEYLEFEFLLENKHKSDKYLEEIFFEDICDACGMLLASANEQKLETRLVNCSPVKFSDIKMLYVDDIENTGYIKDRKIQELGYTEVTINTKTIKRDIMRVVNNNPNEIYCVYIPVTHLGVFGIEHNLTFFSSGDGYLFFYSKKHINKTE